MRVCHEPGVWPALWQAVPGGNRRPCAQRRPKSTWCAEALLRGLEPVGEAYQEDDDELRGLLAKPSCWGVCIALDENCECARGTTIPNCACVCGNSELMCVSRSRSLLCGPLLVAMLAMRGPCSCIFLPGTCK